jgi:hypothetical protein
MTQLRPRRSRSDYGVGGWWWCQPVGFYAFGFLSSLTVRDATVVHVTTAGIRDKIRLRIG